MFVLFFVSFCFQVLILNFSENRCTFWFFHLTFGFVSIFFFICCFAPELQFTHCSLEIDYTSIVFRYSRIVTQLRTHTGSISMHLFGKFCCGLKRVVISSEIYTLEKCIVDFYVYHNFQLCIIVFSLSFAQSVFV